MQYPSILWFRQDLRLEDNPALQAALDQGGPIIPIFIWSPEEEGQWPPGAASRWWLHYSLKELQRQLEGYGSKLLIRQGHTLHCMKELIFETQAKAVFWNRRYEPDSIHRDTHLKTHLKQLGIYTESYNSSLLFEPWMIQTKHETPFQIFTPFWKAFHEIGEPNPPLPAPKSLPKLSQQIKSLPLETLELEPKINWAGGLKEQWQPGSANARSRLDDFINNTLIHYQNFRDRPDVPAISHLSPYLHFGELSPRVVWHKIKTHLIESKNAKEQTQLQQSASAYLRQLGWREFAYHLLFHFPHTPNEPMRPAYKAFPWKHDPIGLHAWQKGETGFPIVDAGMRELWTTGWMHNRVRLIVASFLVKDLLIPWQQGAQWFWDTLVDADLANNTLGWQWTAGCGTDSAPYFRIFNPILQGEKFDPEGVYVRKWVPELANLPDKLLHKPWDASFLELKTANVTLGKNYPYSIVDHAEARDRALRAFAYLKL